MRLGKFIEVLLGSVLSLGLFISCVGTPKRLQLEYIPAIAESPSLDPASVRLVVTDQRADKNIVGPAAFAKDLFKGSQGGLMDLNIILPGGQQVARSVLTADRVVYEAVKERLNLLGVKVDGENPKATITINIADLNVDLKDGDLIAHARLESVITNTGNPLVTRAWVEADSSQKKLPLIDSGGSEVLSEALERAANRLNFVSLNRF
jgi:hypothetical protein